MDSTEVARLAAAHGGVVTAAEARSAGVSWQQMAGLCRTGHWRRIGYGMYQVNALIPSSLATIRAAVSSFGQDAVAVLATAAELHGIAGIPPNALIHVSVPGGSPRGRSGNESLAVHQLVLESNDTTVVAGIRVTTPARTVADLLLRLPRYSAVAVVDSALNRAILKPRELGRVAELLYGRRGAVAARQWLAEADSRAQSPLETRVRLRCADGGVAAVELQHPVRSRHGALLGYADLAWPDSAVLAEAVGVEPHSEPHALLRDRRRQNDFVNAGYTVLRFT